jgi:capsular polysaccharide biosynthesis protein
MDLGEVLRELYRRRWFLFGITLVAGLVTAGYTLMMPNVYESSAALIIREPQSAIDEDSEKASSDDSPNLSVETLQILANSTDILWLFFERLWDEQPLERWKKKSRAKMEEFNIFQVSLSTELKKQQSRTGSSNLLLPILTLKARAHSPGEAQTVANMWATVLEEKSRNIYTTAVEAHEKFIGTMYEQSIAAVAQYETLLSEKTLEAAFDLKRLRIDSVKERSVGLEESIFDLGIDLAVNEIAILKGSRRITEQQHDGEWIGSIAEGAAHRADGYPFDLEGLTPQARKTVHAVERKLKQAESLRGYRRQQNLLGMQKGLEHYELDLTRILTEKAGVDDALPSAQAAMAALSEKMERTPEKITLDKAITNDALWNAYVNKALPNDGKLPVLKSEVVNPLYLLTGEKVVELIASIETLKGSSAQLAKSEEAVSQSIATLESEMDIVQREIDRQEQELGATMSVLAVLREDYLAEIVHVEKLIVGNVRKTEELETKTELRRSIANDVDKLEDDVAGFELEINILTRGVGKRQGVEATLASKAEEVALLKVSAENASRTGTSILYNAQANPQKIAPGRSKIVLASMAVAFALCGVFLFAAKMMRTTSE